MRAAAARAVLVLIVAMLAGLVHADAEPSRRGQLGATVIHGSAISDNAVQDNSVMRTSLAGVKPGMSVTIRKARSADLGIIYDIRRDAILGIDSGDFGVIERQAWADRRSPEFFAGRVATGDVVLAVSGSNGLGWGSSSGDYIGGVYVRSSLGRTGVGRAIMSRLESDIVKRGHECATLDSSPNAVGFYIKLGYALVGLPDNAGALPMRKTLRVPDP